MSGSGMNRPLVVQYRDLPRQGGDRRSRRQHHPERAGRRLVGEKLAPTLWLLGMGTLALGPDRRCRCPSSRPRGRTAPSIMSSGRPAMVGFAMPPFWIGLLLILGFGLELGWLPISGYGTGFVGHLTHMILPGLTIAFFLAPILMQSLRASLLEVLAADHIEVARATRPIRNGGSVSSMRCATRCYRR